MRLIALSLVTLLYFIGSGTRPAHAQCPPGWQPGDGFPGVDGEVKAMITAPNGDLFVGGSFTVAGSVRANSIARWNGQTWRALGSGLVNGEVCSLVRLPDGSIVAGGRFSPTFLQAPSLLSLWNGSTWQSIDDDAVIGPSSTSRIRTMIVLPDGTLVVGGDAFDLADGATNVLIARRSAEGWLPLAFGSGTVRSLLAGPSGDLFAGGNFSLAATSDGEVLATNLARLSGGNWLQFGPILNGQVNTLTFGPDSSMIVGGSFTQAGSTPVSSLAKLSNGVWASINDTPGGSVSSLLTLSNGKVVAVGAIPRPDSSSTSRVVIWDGTTLQRLSGGFVSYSTSAVAELPDGKIVVGGSFAQRGDVLTLNITAWDGANWSALGQGRGVAIRAIQVGTDGQVLIAGSVAPTPRPLSLNCRVSIWNGATVTSFPTIRGFPIALDRLANGEIVVGGEFYELAGQPSGNGSRAVARWDGTSWSMMGNIDGDLRDVLVTRSNDVLIAGLFYDRTGLNQTETPGIVARWNGTAWDTLGDLRTGYVAKLIERTDGSIVAVGRFELSPGSATGATSIATWNGTSWLYTAPQSGGVFFDAAELPNGDIVAGGVFDEIGGQPFNNIARWDGTAWSALGDGSQDWVYAVTARPNGDIIAGGFYRTSATLAISPLAKWTGSQWTSLGFGGNRTIQSLATLDNGDILAGGIFSGAFPTFVAAGLAHYSSGQRSLEIDTQPASVLACAGSGARLSVKLADGVGVAYQWRKNGVPIDVTTNASAASRTLVIREVTPADTGSYTCLARSPCGSIISDAAEISVPEGCNLADVVGQGSVCSDSLLTADDIIAFVGWYFSGNPRADVAGGNQSQEPDGNIGTDDIIVFLGAFFAGCQ